jgi:hypothetical protein
MLRRCLRTPMVFERHADLIFTCLNFLRLIFLYEQHLLILLFYGQLRVYYQKIEEKIDVRGLPGARLSKTLF